jgi:hypothetical protein
MRCIVQCEFTDVKKTQDIVPRAEHLAHVVLLDQLGGIHPERLGEFAEFADRAPLHLDYRQTLTLITSKWWSKVHTGASKRSLIAASTVSNRVRSWFRYGRIVTAAS